MFGCSSFLLRLRTLGVHARRLINAAFRLPAAGTSQRQPEALDYMVSREPRRRPSNSSSRNSTYAAIA
jgi:hypothetical protein